MKFKQFLNEEIPEVFRNDSDAYAEMIASLKRDCQQAIQLYDIEQQKMLYRGVNWKSETTRDRDFFKRNRRLDRKPLSTSWVSHTILDRVFDKVFGWKARSQGVFASCDIADARYYGGGAERVYYFFPCDNWTYLWSPIVKDSVELDVAGFNVKGTQVFDGIQVVYADNIETFGKHPKADKKWENDMVPVIKKIYKDNDIDEYFKRKKTEIMINCDSYYMIKIGYANIYKILQDVKK
jgi:hypothetical protein